MKNIRSFDVFGNIAVVNFPKEFNQAEKRKFAEKLLKNQKQIKTVLEKQGKIYGRLRKIKTKHIAGEKNKEVLYKENKCVFRFNIDTTYFSPRLSNERNEISSMIKKDENVLVMFAGVAPFSIVIAKNSNAKKIYSNEINREANKYAKLNINLNKLNNKIELVSGDIKKVAKKLNIKFDVIVMPRPRLKASFLEQAFMLSKKSTRIYYYDFCNIDDKDLIIEKIKQEAKKCKKKIKILKIKQAGEIAPYKIRLRVDFKIV
ncbi:MAG: 50S ribosomal protein L11 methyltransferase [Nanoarchaeota archaeon]|nr:50S ribosomal protein L11 methyltransferase [Nanoarchaeota archaeon]